MERRKDSKNRVLRTNEMERQNKTYEFRWKDRHGKRHSVYAKTLELLREKEKRIQKDLLDGLDKSRGNVTVNDLYVEWLDLKKGVKVNTLSNYRYIYETFAKNEIGEWQVDEVKRSDVRAFYNYLMDVIGLKTSTIESLHTVLHQVFELGVEDDLLRYNPSDKALREIKKERSFEENKRNGLTYPQQLLFENYLRSSARHKRFYPIFETMLWTGMRAGEVTGLRWCDVDFKNDVISVNHTLVFFKDYKTGKCVYNINTPKTKAGTRLIKMLPNVKEALLMERDNLKELGITCNAIVDGFTDFIFLNKYGNPYNLGVLNKEIRNIIKDCNAKVLSENTDDTKEVVTLPTFSNHSLRHTFTTRMNEANLNIKFMQDMLGHADPEITLNIYTDTTDLLRTNELKKLQEHFQLSAK